MRKLLFLCLFSCFAIIPQARATTVTGTLRDIGGTAIVDANSFVRIELKNFSSNVPRVIGANVIVQPLGKDVYPTTGGAFTTTIQANNTITPAGTFYRVTYIRKGIVFRSADYLINGTSVDLNSAIPITTAPVSSLGLVPDDNVIVGNGVGWDMKQLPACTDQGGHHLNYDASTNNFACGTTGGGSSGGGASGGSSTVDATLMLGADMGEKITAAQSQLSILGGGTIDARGLQCPYDCHIGTADLNVGAAANGQYNFSGVALQLFYAINTHSTASNVVTVPATTWQGIQAVEFTGNASSNIVDTTSSNVGNVVGGGQNVTSGSLATTQNNDLIIGWGADTDLAGTLASGTGFTAVGTAPWNGNALEYLVQPTSGSISATWNYPSTPESYMALSAALKGSGTWAKVNDQISAWNAGDSIAAAFTNPLTPGSVIVVGVVIAYHQKIQVPTDTAGNIYHSLTGGGGNPITVLLPVGTIFRDIIPATGKSAQVLYGSDSSIIGQGKDVTIISGPGDVTAVQQGGTDSVSNAHLADFSILGTGAVVPRSVGLQVGGPFSGWNGVQVAGGAGGADVLTSRFDNIGIGGSIDIGVWLDGHQGCNCYNDFDHITANGASFGVKINNHSGYPGDANSNAWHRLKSFSPIGLYDRGGSKNVFDQVPDFENNYSRNGGGVLAAEPTSQNNGLNYVVGNIVTATAGCTTNPTLEVKFVWADGSVKGPGYGDGEQLSVVTPGTGCPTYASSVSTTGGSGTGLKVNIHTSSFIILLGDGTHVKDPYEEAGAVDYICGQFNEVSGVLGSGNGSVYDPAICPGTNSIYGGPLSNFIWGPGAVPASIGVRNSVFFGGFQHYNDGGNTAAEMDSDGVKWVGSSSAISGWSGHSDWNVGLSLPHSGTMATGKATFSKLAEPSAPVLTAFGGTGTTSAAYGLVCNDNNGGTTLPIAPTTTVSGPAVLGALLTIAVSSGGGSPSGYVTASGTAVTWVSGDQFDTGGSLAGKAMTINGQANTISSVGSATALTLGSTVSGGPYATPVAYSTVSPYSSGDVGTHFTVLGGDGTGEGTIAAVAGGKVTGVSLYAAGSQYNGVASHLSVPNTYPTTGGTGAGLTVVVTSSYIKITYPIEDGCYNKGTYASGWTVLKGDTVHALAGAWTNGTSDASLYITDRGLTPLAYVPNTRNTTGDMSVAGNLSAANFTAADKVRPCEVHIAGTDTGGLLKTGDDTVAAAVCVNATGATLTISHFYCWTDTGTTTTVTPVIAGGAAITSGALTCGSGYASKTEADGAAGRPSLSITTQTAGQAIGAAITAVGTANDVHFEFVRSL